MKHALRWYRLNPGDYEQEDSGQEHKDFGSQGEDTRLSGQELGEAYQGYRFPRPKGTCGQAHEALGVCAAAKTEEKAPQSIAQIILSKEAQFDDYVEEEDLQEKEIIRDEDL